MKACWFALVFLTFHSAMASAEEIRIAVASNFYSTLKSLALVFKKQSGHQLVLASGSSGKHYAQISHGAPFDLFFAADVKRPQLLEQQGLIITGSRFTYAFGRLVLWQPKARMVNSADGATLLAGNHSPLMKLKKGDFNYLAVANPKLAPYGRAAEQTLIKLGLWEQYRNKIVRGENIAQAFHFTSSGNAQLGFIALAQVKNTTANPDSVYWEVPQAYYQPIEQQAVMLTERPASIAFINFLHTKTAQQIIHQAGYLTAIENRP